MSPGNQDQNNQRTRGANFAWAPNRTMNMSYETKIYEHFFVFSYANCCN